MGCSPTQDLQVRSRQHSFVLAPLVDCVVPLIALIDSTHIRTACSTARAGLDAAARCKTTTQSVRIRAARGARVPGPVCSSNVTYLEELSSQHSFSCANLQAPCPLARLPLSGKRTSASEFIARIQRPSADVDSKDAMVARIHGSRVEFDGRLRRMAGWADLARPARAADTAHVFLPRPGCRDGSAPRAPRLAPPFRASGLVVGRWCSCARARIVARATETFASAQRAHPATPGPAVAGSEGAAQRCGLCAVGGGPPPALCYVREKSGLLRKLLLQMRRRRRSRGLEQWP